MLRNLYLDNMDLEPDSGRLDRWLELGSLKKLTVRGCDNMGSFLKDMAISYAYHPGQALKELSIMANLDDQWVTELEPVLKLVSGIERLYVSMSSAECIRVAPIGRHGASLRLLLMDPLNDTRDDRHVEDGTHLYSVGDLDSLVGRCPNLEEIGISLVPVLFGAWDYQIPFAWSPNTEASADERRLKESLVSTSAIQLSIH
jgi:hypothetical protein